MKPFKSHTCLSKLGNPVDRSTMSTPVQRPQLLTSGQAQSRSFMMTPPQLLPSSVVPSPGNAETATPASAAHPKNDDDDDDDVFGADDPPRSTNVTPLGPLPSHTRIEQDPQTLPTEYEYASEYHRRGDELSSDNAQSILPPKALVFVANLPTDLSEEQLVQECIGIFEAFGQCYVTVKRDSRNHPFAFVQYCTEEDALTAIENGKDLAINGRKIRTEKGNARRSVIITRVEGGFVARNEAIEVLSPYGPIENVTPITVHEKTRLGISEGMRVEFQYVGDYMDAMKQFHLDRANMPYGLMHAPDNSAERRQFRPAPAIQAPRSTTDQKSIFVGNLPDGTEEKEIQEKFAQFGTIMTCNIIRKPISGGSGFNVFGFVEFETAAQAEAAAYQTDVDIRGQRIRVEPKEYSARRQTRLSFGRSHAHSYHHHPRGRGWGHHNSQQQYAQAMSGGYFPLYTQTAYGTFVPVHPGFVGLSTTPPQSTYRQSVGQIGYMHHGSPQHAQQGYQARPLIPYARAGGSIDNANSMMQAAQQAGTNPQRASGMQTPHPLQQKRWR